MSADAMLLQPLCALRSHRERVIQSLWFEGLGVVIVGPLYALASGSPMQQSLMLVAVLSLAVLGWSAVYNTAFDAVEARRVARVASARPHRWRMVHAIGLETSAALVTWPLIYALTPLSWAQALLADIGLSVAYAVYGYLFHLGFDRLRPVRADTRGAGRDSQGDAA
jgi:uncharacterized membrane protein